MMKKKNLGALLSICAVMLFTLSCSDDDDGSSKNVLITSHRGTGQFYTINLTTGETTEAFTITEGANTLKDLRAFVYHGKAKKFFVSESTDPGGKLYSVNASTKVATLINDNSGGEGGTEYDVWDAVVNWAVASDDSLIAVGDFNDDGNGTVKFGTDGGRSSITTEADICCGLGLIYDKSSGDFTVGNGWSSDDGEVIIERFNKNGVSQDETIITTFEGFPGDDITTEWLTVKGLAKAGNGTVYGLVFTYDTKNTYFVKIDLEGETVSYISTLGTGGSNQYNLLAFIPGSKL